MKTDFPFPLSTETQEATVDLDVYRMNFRAKVLDSDPLRWAKTPAEDWKFSGASRELMDKVRWGRASQAFINNAERRQWRGTEHEYAGASRDGALILSVGPGLLLAILVGLIWSTLPAVLTLLACLIAGMFVPVPQYHEAKTDKGMDLAVVRSYHQELLEDFQKNVQKFTDLLALDVEKAGYTITDVNTSFNGLAWTTRFVALNGSVAVSGDLRDGLGHIIGEVAQRHVRSEWGGVVEELELDDVQDLRGNTITPIGITTKGTWQ